MQTLFLQGKQRDQWVQYFKDSWNGKDAILNFFGVPGMSLHKQVVKAPDLKTQRHVSEFVCQVAKQYHHVMVWLHAFTRCGRGCAININERKSIMSTQ